MASEDPAGTRPGPVALRIKLRYEDVGAMIQRFAPHVGRSGLFLPTRSLQPIGTEVKFELRLANDQPVLVGLGRVQHAKEPDPEHPAAAYGLGIELMRVTREGRELILKLLARRRELGLSDVALPRAEEIDAARRDAEASGVPQPITSPLASQPVAVVAPSAAAEPVAAAAPAPVVAVAPSAAVEPVVAAAPEAVASQPIAAVSPGPVAAVDPKPTAAAASKPMAAIASPSVAAAVAQPVAVAASQPVAAAAPAPAPAVAPRAAASIAPLPAEPPRRKRRPVSELIESASGPSAAALAIPGLDEEVDLGKALARARVLAGGDLDQELEVLRDRAAAPLAEVSIEEVSADLARQLGGVAVRRDRSQGWAPPPAVAGEGAEAKVVETGESAEAVESAAPIEVLVEATAPTAVAVAEAGVVAAQPAGEASPALVEERAVAGAAEAPPAIVEAVAVAAEAPPAVVEAVATAAESSPAIAEAVEAVAAAPSAVVEARAAAAPEAAASPAIAEAPAAPSQPAPAREPGRTRVIARAGEDRARLRTAAARRSFGPRNVDQVVTQPAIPVASAARAAAVIDSSPVAHDDDDEHTEIGSLPVDPSEEPTAFGGVPTPAAASFGAAPPDPLRPKAPEVAAAPAGPTGNTDGADDAEEIEEIEEIDEFEILSEADASDADLLTASGERDRVVSEAPRAPPLLQSGLDFASRLDLGDDSDFYVPAAAVAVFEEHRAAHARAPLTLDPDEGFDELAGVGRRPGTGGGRGAAARPISQGAQPTGTRPAREPAQDGGAHHAGFPPLHAFDQSDVLVVPPELRERPEAAAADPDLENAIEALDVNLDDLSNPHASTELLRDGSAPARGSRATIRPAAATSPPRTGPARQTGASRVASPAAATPARQTGASRVASPAAATPARQTGGSRVASPAAAAPTPATSARQTGGSGVVRPAASTPATPATPATPSGRGVRPRSEDGILINFDDEEDDSGR